MPDSMDKEKEIAVAEKAVDFNKMMGDSPIAYTSATTLADAMAQMDAQESMSELRQCLGLYEQVVNNIMWSSVVTDKKAALASAAQEFQDMMTADMAGTDEAKAVTKKEGDGNHPASHYLVIEDSAKPTPVSYTHLTLPTNREV